MAESMTLPLKVPLSHVPGILTVIFLPGSAMKEPLSVIFGEAGRTAISIELFPLPPSQSAVYVTFALPIPSALNSRGKETEAPFFITAENSDLPFAATGPSVLTVSFTEAAAEPVLNTEQGTVISSPGANTLGRDGSIVMSLFILTSSSLLPLAEVVTATAVRRAVPENSGITNVKSQTPSALLRTIFARESILNLLA